MSDAPTPPVAQPGDQPGGKPFVSTGSAAGETPASPPSQAEGAQLGLKRLERELRVARANGAKAMRQLHGVLVAEVRAAEKGRRQAEKRAASAERQLKAARKRARQAEAELRAVRESTTWKAGRAVVAVPARLRRLRG